MTRPKSQKTPVAPYEASKWLSIQALLSASEMKDLMESLPPFFIITVGAVLDKNSYLIEKETFCHTYSNYVETLERGEAVDINSYRLPFSSSLSVSLDHFVAHTINDEKEIVKIVKPVVQLQVHAMGYSAIDGKFRPLVFGKDSISWGLQFSYPTLFQDSNGSVYRVDQTFPNTPLFHAIQKWIRKKTIPTPMLVGNQKINLPIRIGRECLSWTSNHPDLQKHSLRVAI